MQTKTLWGGITKIDTSKQIVGGYYTDDKVDMVGDRILKEATLAALPEWSEWGNIREQHGMPVGTAVSIGEPEWNYLEAHIVDDDAWKKVMGGVYKGFSVGIIVDDMSPVSSNKVADEFWPDNAKELRLQFPMVNEIKKIQLIECSITDRPANPRAKFVMMKKADLPMDIEPDAEKKAGSSEVQTLILSKDKFPTEAEAEKWVAGHNFTHSKVDEKENTWRYRQFDPAECEKDSFGTKDMTDGVQAVFCVRQPAKNITPTDEKEAETETSDQQPDVEKATWSTAAVNEAKDLVFAAVEPTGEKDDAGRTLPKNARHEPHHDLGATSHSDSSVDLPHLRNALARVNQLKPVTDQIGTAELQKKAQSHLDAHKHLLDGSGKSLMDDALVAEQRKEMDEKEKKVEETTPAVGAEETPIEEKTVPVEEKKEEPTVEKAIEPEVQKANMEDAMKKMDEVMAKMDAMMAKMDGQMDNSAQPEVTKSEETETTPVEPVKAEESAKGELEVTVKALLDEEKKARKAELEALTKTIMAEVSKQIEELKKPLPGKAAMKSDEKPEEKKVDLKTLTPGERRKKLKETLDKAFTQEK